MAIESLFIGSLTTDVMLPHNHPRPHDVREQVDSAQRHLLEAALKQVFNSGEYASRDELLLIPRLELELEWNASLDASALAREWARAIARSVAEQLEAESSGTLRFSTPAALLGQYLRDRASGAAGNRWYYRRFEGLAILPAAAAIRTAILDDAGTGLDALLRLPPPELLNVLGALSDSDLQRIIAAFATGAAPPEEAALGLLDAWRRYPERPARLALLAARLFLEALREHPQARGRQLETLAHAVARYFTAAPDVADAVNRADLAGLYDAAGADLAHALHPLAELPADIRVQFAAARTAAPREVRSTAFGGVFLLLPILDEIFPVDDDGTLEAIHLRYLALMNCYGPKRSAAFLACPLLADLFEVPSNLDVEAQPEAGPLAGELLRAFGRRLPGFAESSPAHLAANFLEFNATVETEPGSPLILVRASYPPLGVILSINGMLRQSYSLRWKPDREWRVFPEA